MARAMGARLTLLSVRSFVLGRSAVAGLPTPDDIAEGLARAAEVARHNGFEDPALVDLRGRDAAVRIADYADDHDVNLIIVGSTGKDALTRFALGSTSMDLLRKSACPVTIVH
jgi:nucleotide-binding universal stress UspA family protein